MGFTCALRVTTQAVVSYTALPPLRKRGHRSEDLPQNFHTVSRAQSARDTRHSPRTPTFVHLCSCRQVCPAHPPKTRTVWTHCLRGTFLLHCPGSRLHQTLSGILPCEARTFLSCSLSALTAATICPAQNISKFIRFQRKLQVLSPCFFILFLRIRF